MRFNYDQVDQFVTLVFTMFCFSLDFSSTVTRVRELEDGGRVKGLRDQGKVGVNVFFVLF